MAGSGGADRVKRQREEEHAQMQSLMEEHWQFDMKLHRIRTLKFARGETRSVSTAKRQEGRHEGVKER